MKSRIFITGASGYLGGAIAVRLARAGHEIIGLVRTPEHAELLRRGGVQPQLGDLTKPETFVSVLKNCDAAVHASDAREGSPAALDQKALEAFGDAAEDGRLRRLLYTSGLWVHGDVHGETIDESAPLNPLELVTWRAAHEDVVMDLAQQEVVSVVFRPGIVYGESRGILGGWFREARDKHTVTYWGDGSQVWSMVHRDDVAEAYRLGLEHANAGDRFLLADGSTHTVRELAEAVARVTGATAKPWAAEEVVQTLGAYGKALLSSARINATKARRDLGWVPRHTSFVAEIDSLYREWLGPREAQVS
jgi:nucleoside-diphosphate-sugar epimerase